VVVVGLSDNFLKPLLMKGDVHLHPALIFFALLGGLSYFGGIGLIAGPMILVFFLAVVRMCRKEYRPEPDEA
jgi:predicted PurR-regulated permease PerM